LKKAACWLSHFTTTQLYEIWFLWYPDIHAKYWIFYAATTM